MLKSISFKSLQFVKPFSEITEYGNQHKGQLAFLKGATKVPGILITKYCDLNNLTRYKFSSTSLSLNTTASSVYKLLRKRKATEIEFALIPAEKNVHRRVVRLLKKEYLQTPLDSHYNILKPWLEEERTDSLPIEQLKFRRPFTCVDGLKPYSSFNGYEGRGGIYIIRETLVAQNITQNVYVGKSFSVLRCRIKDKFYPNPHLYYREIPGVREYHISVIEIQGNMIPRRKSFTKTLVGYENVLISLLDPRDNKLGRVVNNSLPVSGYVPIHKGKGMPFPITTTYATPS